MANLKFCDTHNMVAYLLNTEGSKGFHQIVDFLNSSHIKYALTENPTTYTLLIQQFWQTTVANTLDIGKVQITATIDGKVKLVYEASIRRHLKLEDSDAVRLQEQLDEEERQRISRVHEEASSFNVEEWEEIQATIEANEELALKIQEEEREKYSEVEKARLLVDVINQRKRHFAK
nr:hypothetical protein [Tanacetum cinerariifolium]